MGQREYKAEKTDEVCSVSRLESKHQKGNERTIKLLLYFHVSGSGS
jgi:hypothetical protein